MKLGNAPPDLYLALVALALLAGCSRAGPTPQPSLPAVLELGERLYNENCLGCHGGATGGSMRDIPPRHNANGHTMTHPDCQLVDTIMDGSGAMGETMRQMMEVPEGVPRMPAFKDKLSEEDTRAVLAFIKTWWTEDQRRTQAAITQRQCPGS